MTPRSSEVLLTVVTRSSPVLALHGAPHGGLRNGKRQRLFLNLAAGPWICSWAGVRSQGLKRFRWVGIYCLAGAVLLGAPLLLMHMACLMLPSGAAVRLVCTSGRAAPHIWMVTPEPRLDGRHSC